MDVFKHMKNLWSVTIQPCCQSYFLEKLSNHFFFCDLWEMFYELKFNNN